MHVLERFGISQSLFNEKKYVVMGSDFKRFDYPRKEKPAVSSRPNKVHA
jgi:hypothetical protein